MDKRLMHYQFPYEVPQIDGTMVELHRKIAAVVADTGDDAIVNAILDVAKKNEVTDLYLLDKQFIMDAIREKKERENPKPLTLEELRQMIGEPVYLKFQNESIKSSGWDVLKSVKMTEDGDYLEVIRGQLYTINGLERFSFQGGNYFARDYGYTWTAYRHKQKEDNDG